MIFLIIFCFCIVNRRLDEWVGIEKIDLRSLYDENSRKDSFSLSSHLIDIGNGPDRKVTRNQKRKHDEVNHIQKVLIIIY